MLRVLISVGRRAVVVAAIMGTFAAAFYGWAFGPGLILSTGVILYDPASMPVLQALCGLVGAGVGFIIAGASLGLAASVFEIHRILDRDASVETAGGLFTHRAAIGRREPRLDADQ